jgi:hypothetical protein
MHTVLDSQKLMHKGRISVDFPQNKYLAVGVWLGEDGASR